MNSSLSVARELILSLGTKVNSPNLLLKKLVEKTPSLVDYGRKTLFLCVSVIVLYCVSSSVG